MLGAYNAFTPKSGRLKDILIWLFCVVVFFGIGVIISAAAAGALMGHLSLEVATLLTYPLMFIPLMIFALRPGKSRLEAGCEVDRPLSRTGVGPSAVAALAIVTLFGGFMCDGIVSLFPPMPESLKAALEAMTSGTLWVNLLCTAVFAPFFEEWLCRGTILRGLRESGVNPAVCVVVSSLFFAVIHANVWQGVPAFIIGCLFGYVYLKTGSLKLTMILHCVNNAFCVVLTRIDAFSDAQSWVDVMPHHLYWILFAVFAAVSSLVLVNFGRSRRCREM